VTTGLFDALAKSLRRGGFSPIPLPNYYLTAAQQPGARYLGRRQVVLGGETGRSS